MTTASFWIEIIPKPIYVGGSGPPMAPVTWLPEHDEESWVIAELIQYKKESHYVVHPKNKPVVRKIVRKIDALDWVSPRVLEAFEMEEAIRRDTREEEQKQGRVKNKLTKNGKKRGRPFKYTQPGASASLVESIETETDTQDDAAQPSTSQPSLSQPSLSQPHLTLRHRSDSPFDTENTEDEGILGSMEPPPSKRSRTDTSAGPSSKTPRNPQEPLSSPQTVQNPAPTSARLRSSKSTAEPETPHHTPSKSRTPGHRSTASAATSSERRELRDRSAQPFYGHRQRSQSALASNSASPAKSRKSTTPARHTTRSSSRSRNATPSGEKVHKPAAKGWNSAPPKPVSTPQKRPKAPTPSKSQPGRPAAGSDDEDGDEDEVTSGKQWKVLRLLDDRYRLRKNRRCHYYLTQWAGNYAPTWERSTNITSDLKIEYETWKKTAEGKARKGKDVEKAGRRDSVEKGRETFVDDPHPRNEDDRPLESRSSSVDDQAQASRQLGTDINDRLAPANNSRDSDSADTPDPLTAGIAPDNSRDSDADDTPDPLTADAPPTMKRERSEGPLARLPLARSPYFP
ncbi:hypothetical protein VE03_09914 [Pseudogymnoascus sp. 23342-1-I1]|nr:hypothetical protein VE03_09914 [Pseudogymnoascus sp. 23342-1-I1]